MNDTVRELVVKPLTRSSGWSKVRKEHLKRHPECAICGTKDQPAVHHIVPFGEDPHLELNPVNLITLCRKYKHHFTFGHLMKWKLYNPEIVQSAQYYQELIRKAKRIDLDLTT